ncbi:MAG TPA: DUF47 family protein [Ignavibacteria bacterium]
MLKKTKKIELQIDEYLDMVLRGALIFKEGIKYYLSGQLDEFHQKLDEASRTESEGDNLRRVIETKLYINTLIPEHRGDVLGIIENSDKVLNTLEEVLSQFAVETPEILPELSQYFLELSDSAVSSVESMVQAVRAYFKNINEVRDHINKVMFFEKESDKIADKIKRMVFRMENLELSSKIHIRYFAFHIENIADSAEDVCDRLSIAAIKREL